MNLKVFFYLELYNFTKTKLNYFCEHFERIFLLKFRQINVIDLNRKHVSGYFV